MDEQGVKCKGDTSSFYPNNPSSEVAKAKARCNGSVNRETGIEIIDPPCPFLERCLHHAIDRKELFGVWGGTSERDRRKIWKARKRNNNPNIYNLEGVVFPGQVIIEIRSKHAS